MLLEVTIYFPILLIILEIFGSLNMLTIMVLVQAISFTLKMVNIFPWTLVKMYLT